MFALLALLIAAQAPPQPTFNYTAFGGCNDLIGYAANPTWSEVLTIDVALMDRRLGPNLILLPAEPAPPGTHEYDLADAKGGARSSIELYQRAGTWPCGDARIGPLAIWKAVAGRLTVTVRALETPSERCPPTSRCYGRVYNADVRLTDAVFEAPNGDRVRLPKPVEFTVLGGYRYYLPP